MLTPRLLAVHRAVVEAGTLTAAAASLGFTVSAVSHQLDTLEHEAGQPLWERVGRGVRPTPAGLLLAEHADRILDAVRQAEAGLEDLRLGRTGRLRVISFHSAGESILPEAIAALRITNPGLVIVPQVDEGDSALRRLRDGDVDVVISLEPYGRNESPSDELHRTHLLDDEYRVLLRDDHPLARHRTIDLAALADDDWIVTTSAGRAQSQFQPMNNPYDDTVVACRRAGFVPRVVAQADTFAVTQSYVSVGLGVALLPLLALGAVRRQVVVRKLRRPPEPRHIWLLTRPTLVSRVPVQALTAALRSIPLRDHRARQE